MVPEQREYKYKKNVQTFVWILTAFETLCILYLWPDVRVPLFSYELFASGALFGILRWINPSEGDARSNALMFLLIFFVNVVVYKRLDEHSAFRGLTIARGAISFFAAGHSARVHKETHLFHEPIQNLDERKNE